jgi:cell division transport system ATP-binding protein
MSTEINIKEKPVEETPAPLKVPKEEHLDEEKTADADTAETQKKVEEKKQAATKTAEEPKAEKKKADSSDDTVIEFKNVTKSYLGGIKAVDSVSFKIDLGEFISLVGPSGAGKSTLIKLLTCEEKPTSGQGLVAGRDISQLQPKEVPFFRRKVGVIFQDFKLLPKKTVYENIAFALEVADASDGEIAQNVPKIIQIVGLTSRRNALSEELSGGEKQRVSIARALVHKPKLLIADEPTGNLDPVATWEIIELLFKINKQGTIVLLATHDKEVVDALEKRVITMRQGKIVSDQKKGKYIL